MTKGAHKLTKFNSQKTVTIATKKIEIIKNEHETAREIKDMILDAGCMQPVISFISYGRNQSGNKQCDEGGTKSNYGA